MLGHTSISMTLDKYTHKEDKKRGQFLKAGLAPNDTEIGTKLLEIA